MNHISVYRQPEINIDLSTASPSSQNMQDFVTSSPKGTDLITGYIIIDTSILSEVINMLYYAQCDCPTLSLGDGPLKKQGLSSLLFIDCLNQSCKFINEFHTSMPSGIGFDLNKRTPYTMRVLGHVHSVIERFTSLMIMPKPMTKNNYDKVILKIVSACCQSVQTFAFGDM